MRTEKEVRDFDLTHIFECGQCFRWERETDGSYTGTAQGRTVNLRLRPKDEADGARVLVIDGADGEEFNRIWRPYLDLDRDYGEIKRALVAGGKQDGCCDPVMQGAIACGSGIRILRQDPWETLISFLISQNSNIPRIRRCIETLSSLYGEELPEYRGKRRFAFPSARTLAALSEDDLAPARLGYRARYIAETARAVAADGGKTLAALPELSYEDGYAYLTGLCGVGPKVANCILLFAGAKYESFPIDVWMRRVMSTLYHIKESDLPAMRDFAAARFGAYGGFAQQYLFYYIRSRQESEKI